jgi:hypothetical protein
MTWSYVRAGGTLDSVWDETPAVTVPAAGHAVGNVVVVFWFSGSDIGATTCTDSRSNTYNVRTYWSGTDLYQYVGIAWSKLTTALQSADTITLSPTAGGGCVVVSHEYTATNGSVATTDTAGDVETGYATAWDSASITPTSSRNALLLVGVCHGAATRSTPDANWNERNDASPASAPREYLVQDRFVVSTSGSYSGGGDFAASDTATVMIVAVLEAAAGATLKRFLSILGTGT